MIIRSGSAGCGYVLEKWLIYAGDTAVEGETVLVM